MGNPRPTVAYADDECLGFFAGDEAKFDLSAAGVFERIAREFRNRRGDPRLVLRIEADQLRQSSRPLADQDDVRFRGDRDQQEAWVHTELYTTGRIATTEASSRARRWSRNSTPAIR